MHVTWVIYRWKKGQSMKSLRSLIKASQAMLSSACTGLANSPWKPTVSGRTFLGEHPELLPTALAAEQVQVVTRGVQVAAWPGAQGTSRHWHRLHNGPIASLCQSWKGEKKGPRMEKKTSSELHISARDRQPKGTNRGIRCCFRRLFQGRRKGQTCWLVVRLTWLNARWRSNILRSHRKTAWKLLNYSPPPPPLDQVYESLAREIWVSWVTRGHYSYSYNHWFDTCKMNHFYK